MATLQRFWERQQSDDLLFLFLVAIDAQLRPVSPLSPVLHAADVANCVQVAWLHIQQATVLNNSSFCGMCHEGATKMHGCRAHEHVRHAHKSDQAMKRASG